MSLRRALIAAFSLLLTAVGAVSALYAHHAAKREVWGILDLQQRQVARFIGDGSGVGTGELRLPPGEDDEDLVVAISYADGRPARVSRPGVDFPETSEAGFSLFSDASGEWRLFTLVDGPRTVRVAQQTAEREEIAADAAWDSALPFVLAIPLSWLVVYGLVGAIMGRLHGIAAEVAGRRAGDVRAIDVRRAPSEVRPLITAMNKAFGGLSAALAQQKIFISDAAHELRTPLTALNLQVGNVAALNRDPALAAPIGDLATGIRRASRLTARLLQLAREEALVEDAAADPVDLGEAAAEAIAGLLPLADSRRIDLGMAASQAARVRATPAALVGLIEILVDNAVRYTPEGGRVDVTVALSGGHAVLTVEDTGPGIPEALRERVFDRFYRAGPPDGEGSGLGLSIARTVARRLGAELTLHGRQDGEGLEARIVFPAA